jgi:hypothetical protein
LDYHQSGVQVCVMDAEGNVLVNRKCENEWATIVATVGGEGVVVQAAIEACCGAANLAKCRTRSARTPGQRASIAAAR